MAIADCAIDRASAAQRPSGAPCGYHRWHSLLFVHWRVPAAELASLIPPGLTLDTWHGEAFVALVPFGLSGVRPWWSPPVPGVSSFLEINVRTYVHCQGRDPGVLFLSLDADSRLAVAVGRRLWRLNYRLARLRLDRQGDRIRYSSRRRHGPARGVGAALAAHVGPLLGSDEAGRELPPGRAAPGTLDYFLLERYVLYSHAGGGPLRQGRVHHPPYRIHQAQLVDCDENLVAACGMTRGGEPCHVAFVEQIDVAIYPLAVVRN